MEKETIKALIVAGSSLIGAGFTVWVRSRARRAKVEKERENDSAGAEGGE